MILFNGRTRATRSSLLGFLLISLFPFQAYSYFDSQEAADTCNPQEFQRYRQIRARVERVVDGDTIRIAYSSKKGTRSFSVRFLSIDTPETNYQGMSQGYWGDRATQRMQSMLPVGATVRIVFDNERCDHYGRMLGHVWIGNTNTNKVMVQEGYAVNYCIFPNLKFCEEYAEVTQRAIDNSRGIWSKTGPEIPYVWRRVVSGRPNDKYVGNLFTKSVWGPDAIDDIPVAERVFFFEKEHIQPPFELME